MEQEFSECITEIVKGEKVKVQICKKITTRYSDTYVGTIYYIDFFRFAQSISSEKRTLDIVRYIGWPNEHLRYKFGIGFSEEQCNVKRSWLKIKNPNIFHNTIANYMKPKIEEFYKDKLVKNIVVDICEFLRCKEMKKVLLDLMEKNIKKYKRSDYINIIFYLEFNMYPEIQKLF
jgi:hypothetical protein